METIERLLALLDTQMERPIPYQSWFHIGSLILVFLIAIFFTVRLRHASKETMRIFVLTVGITMIVFEIYKQVNFSYTNDWSYRWYAFPFQFCSTPMYGALIAGWSKNERLRTALYGFLATYGFVAGAFVMFVPHDVFTDTIGINIQTMVHHGGAAVMGSVLLFADIPGKSIRFGRAASVYVVTVAIAMVLNALHNSFIQDGTFNMFFINPRHGIHIDWVKPFYETVTYIPYLLTYVLGFTFVSYGVLVIGRTVRSQRERSAYRRRREAIQCSH
ncbi:MAG: hypothetical protein ACLFTZ_01395 [Acholeplasmataceae bacterium]